MQGFKFQDSGFGIQVQTISNKIKLFQTLKKTPRQNFLSENFATPLKKRGILPFSKISFSQSHLSD